MPNTFDNLGIKFQYPDNWTLDEQDARAGQASVTVYSPAGAFWSVTVHPRGADPAELAQAAVDAMRQEYEEVEAEEVQQTLAEREMTGFDLNFFFLDLTNTACVRTFQGRRGTYTVFYQAEDRDFGRWARVFEAMTVSLLKNVP